MKIRYANVAATLAVVVAASSGAYAITLAKGSVRTKHIKKSAVTKDKLAKNSVVSSKVKNGSLRAADFKAGQLPQGAPGSAVRMVWMAIRASRASSTYVKLSAA